MGNDKIKLPSKSRIIIVRNCLKNQVFNNQLFILILFIIIILVLMLIFRREYFYSNQNLGTILLNLSTSGFLVVGMMFLMVGGVFDLSIGANLALSAVISGYFLKNFTNLPVFISAIIGIFVAATIGLINGLVVNKLKVNAFMATLGMMSICRALAIIIGGPGIGGLPKEFLVFGQKTYFGFQSPVFYMVIITIVGYLLLRKTQFFRQLYFIGSNQKAAMLSGINVERTMILMFVIMGVLAGFTGLVLASRLDVAVGTVGEGLNLQVIAAALMGGASLSGGKGSILGAFLGALFISLLSNIMVLSDINIYLQNGIVGLILIFALGFDVVLNRKYRAI